MYAEPELLFYKDGHYHALQHDYWQRVVGRTAPAYDPLRCHSGCTPPARLRWEAGILYVLVVGYDAEACDTLATAVQRLPQRLAHTLVATPCE